MGKLGYNHSEHLQSVRSSSICMIVVGNIVIVIVMMWMCRLRMS